MKQRIVFLTLLIVSTFSNAQTKKFNKLLERNLKETVPIVKVSDISSLDKYVLLDTREQNEYDTSHLKNALCVGFDYFEIDAVLQKYPDKSQPILVYCSIGMRSEMIGEKLLKSGYTKVYNLYGGIFEWKNQAKEIVDKNNQPTEKVHTFSKEWSKWLTNGEKVYEK